MQLTITTDYAIRIVCYLAKKQQMISAAELAQELQVPISYIPKVTKQLKKAKIIAAMEGTHGGYSLAKKPEDISLLDVIASTESTMAINRCMEKDGFCSRNAADTCKIHKIFLDLQNTYNNRLENILISDIIQPGRDEYFGRFYMVMKVDLKEKTYECIYSHSKEIYEQVEQAGNYKTFTDVYIKTFVHAEDQKKTEEFLSSEKMTEHLQNGCLEEDIHYRRRNEAGAESYVWMEMKKYVDEGQHTAMLTFHNAKMIPNTIITMEQEIQRQERDVEKQYWEMVSLLVAVLNHNNLLETEHQDDICFYTEQVYRQLQQHFPEYGITEEEIKNVSHLAPIHDIGKIRVPLEILNKKGKLSKEEMDVVRQHPLTGAEMTLRFPKGIMTKSLNRYSYDICRFHHERYDGNGYPDGLKGNEIPLCAQVVGLVDAYDALISNRPYKGPLNRIEAIRMIINGECGAFSNQLLQCFLAATMQPEWIEKGESVTALRGGERE